MASIERRTGDNGKPQYRARWRDAEGRSRRSRWFDRKLDADRHRATIEADLHRGAYVDMHNRVTVAEYARAWGAARPYRATSRRWLDGFISKHLDGTPLGARPLVKVRPSEIQAWATSRAGVLAPGSLRIRLGILRSIFGTAALDSVIARNPVQPTNRLSLPKREHDSVVPLTVEQIRALTAETPARYRAMVVAHAGLGLRMGELLALRVEDVNFLRRTVHVEHQLDVKTLERVPPKTPKSRRDIPLPSVVAEALAEHLRKYPPASDGTIFTFASDIGRPRTITAGSQAVSHRRYGGLIQRAAQRAGLPPTTTHDLRHHYACVLLHAGESVHAVAERLGHTDPTLVLKVYGHEMPNTEDRTRRAIDAAWAADAGRAGEALGE